MLARPSACPSFWADVYRIFSILRIRSILCLLPCTCQEYWTLWSSFVCIYFCQYQVQTCVSLCFSPIFVGVVVIHQVYRILESLFTQCHRILGLFLLAGLLATLGQFRPQAIDVWCNRISILRLVFKVIRSSICCLLEPKCWSF